MSAALSAARLAALMDRPSPTAEQTAVIEADPGPMLVVAGAGSGKTETMASRVVWLIANGIVEPRQVLGLTFTRKASIELSERIGSRLALLATALRGEGMALPPGLERTDEDLLGQRPAVRTYNGFALDLVTEHALDVGLDPEFSMLSPSASWQLAHEIVESSTDELALDASPSTITAALVAFTSSLSDHLVAPAAADALLRKIRDHLSGIPLQAEGKRRVTPKPVLAALAAIEGRLALLPLVERFAAVRRERAALDFSDQVTLAARIAQGVPAAGELSRDLHRVVLLDEFQDTSVAQLELLSGLFGAGHATCAVGDPQQAIYGWRGASSASLAAFVRAFGTPERPVVQRTLSTSWRNDEAPLAVANRIAGPLRADAGGVRIPELAARPGAGEGAVEVMETADEESEARAIARWILERRHETDPPRGTPAADGGGPSVDHPADPGATAAVLVRTRRQIAPLVQGLEEAGLVVEVVGLGGLLHRPEVADVRALLECVHDPGRGDSLMRLLAGPRFRLGARDLAVLGRWREHLASRARRISAHDADDAVRRLVADDAEDVTLLDALDDLPSLTWEDREERTLSPTGRQRLLGLQEVLRGMRRRTSLALPDLVTAATQALGVDLVLLADPARDPARALHDLEAFRDHAAEFERTALRPGLGPFLALLDVSEDKEAGLAVTAGEAATDPAAVTIVTMHAAKGLEWDLVVVAGLAEGTLPSYDLRRARTGEDGVVRVPSPGWLGPLSDAAVPTALRGDADQLPDLAWAEADTQVEAEELLQDYYERAGTAAMTEDRRLMYVAVTRARRRLLLTTAAWRGTRRTPQPRSRYLTEILPLVPERFRTQEEIPEENPLVRVADHAQWPPEPAEPERLRAAAAELVAGAGPVPEDAELAEQTRRVIADLESRRGSIPVRAPSRMSASEVVARARDPEQASWDLLRPLPRRPSPAARRGTSFHAWLEERFGAATLLDLSDLTELADDSDPFEVTDQVDGHESVDDTEQFDGTASRGRSDAVVLAEMREAFERSPWAERTPVAVEEPVTTTIGGIAVRGVIDAIYEDEDGVVIVDWKTGRPPTGRDRRARALQLSVYRLAWHERTGTPLSRIRTMFHYVAAGVTHEVRDHPDREELAELLSAGPAGAGGD
ncbi:ATP-dependent helicase [Brachybacterium sp. AOP25-B2-12]|uniref:ATP-dependent helicase n=1 Tax=Brachybacterium sp. AOP25-B2-12 TaxID=3457710 RepID=UPI004034117A